MEQLLSTTADTPASFRDRILIDDSSWWGEAADPFDIRSLIEALWQQKSLQMTYAKSDGASEQRRVDPYGLVLKHTVWYLIAYCHKASAIRTFRCDRIAAVSLTERTYHIPHSFNLDSHWQQSVQRFRASKENSEEYLVTLEIPAAFAERFEDRVISWNGKKDGRLHRRAEHEQLQPGQS